jgi:glutamyl aminopeptidase
MIEIEFILQILQALTENVIPVMWDDAKPSSHPIVVKNVTSAAEITSLFDSITYSKGASILRMLELIVGSSKFQESLQNYLTANKFSVGDPNTFYNGLFTDTSGEDFMRNWLEEQNFPLLKVNLSVENDQTQLIFTQSRFIISDVLNTSSLNETYRWKIFTDCVLGNELDSDTIVISLRLETEEETRNITGSYSWIKCNRDFQGFFVTDYIFPTDAWSDFSDMLETDPTVNNQILDKFQFSICF